MKRIKKNGIFVAGIQFFLLFLFSLSLLAQTSSQSQTSSSQSQKGKYRTIRVNIELPPSNEEDIGFLFWNVGAETGTGSKCGKECRKILKQTGYLILKKACEKGKAKGCRLLGLYLILEKGKRLQGKDFLFKGCNLGDPWSCMSVLSLDLLNVKENIREITPIWKKLEKICLRHRKNRSLTFSACSLVGRVWELLVPVRGIKAKINALTSYAYGCMHGESEDIASYHRLCLKGARLAFQLDKIKGAQKEVQVKDINYKRLGCRLLYQALKKPEWFLDFKIQDSKKNQRKRNKEDELFRISVGLSCNELLVTRTYKALLKEIRHHCGEFEKFAKHPWHPFVEK